MTNEEKAKEIGENRNNIARFRFENTETTLYYGALEMAEWKDKLFKECLEKKKAELINSNCISLEPYIEFIDEIINKLF